MELRPHIDYRTQRLLAEADARRLTAGSRPRSLRHPAASAIAGVIVAMTLLFAIASTTTVPKLSEPGSSIAPAAAATAGPDRAAPAPGPAGIPYPR
jgi:hypothetical protein